MFDVHDRSTVLWFHLPQIAHRTPPFNIIRCNVMWCLVFVLILWLFVLPFGLLGTSAIFSFIIICCLSTIDIGTHDTYTIIFVFFLFALWWWKFCFMWSCLIYFRLLNPFTTSSVFFRCCTATQRSLFSSAWFILFFSALLFSKFQICWCIKRLLYRQFDGYGKAVERAGIRISVQFVIINYYYHSMLDWMTRKNIEQVVFYLSHFNKSCHLRIFCHTPFQFFVLVHFTLTNPA